MSTITTRAGKGSPLTNAEVDANFTNLNTDKAELSGATFTGDVASTGFSGDITGAILFQAKAGEALTKGDPVYISGISGNQTVVSKADANDANKMPCFGIVDATVSINANCSVVTFGTLSSLDTSAFGEGDELYISDTGTLSTTAPTGEASQLQKIAKVTRSHASAGSIKVMGAGRTNATPNLDDGKFFLGNSSNQSASATFSTSVTGIALPLSGGAMTGAITTNSTFDGRDVATDGSKLDGIESGATADQTAAEIKTAYESNADTNAFTDADESKLDGIEAGADVTDTNTVTSAGALMDSELTSIASVKALNQGVATTDSPTFAGLTVDTNTLYVDSTNNRVGIGTSSPAKLLHLSESADGAKLRITRAGVSEWDFSIGNTSTLTGVGAGALEILPQVGGTSNELAIGTAGSAVPLVHITNSQNYFKNKVGIGTSSPSTKLHLGGTAPLDSIIRQDSTVSGTNWEIGEREAGKWQIWEDDSDSVVATFMSSGNVGIGNSSPVEMLTIGSTSDTNVRAQFLSSTTGGNTIQFGDGTGASAYAGYINYTHSDNALAFATGSSERMRIDGSGRLGLGVTPEAWSSVFKVLRVGTGSSIAGESGGTSTWFNTNAYYDGSWKRINTNTSAQIAHTSDGKQEFKVAASGSAGGVISWNTAMTVDNSGNLLVGKTSTSQTTAGTVLYSNGQVYSTASGTQASVLTRLSSDGPIQIFYKDSSEVGSIGSNAAGGTPVLDISANSSSGIMRMLTSGAERMRIDSSGNVGIGTSSPISALSIARGSGINAYIEVAGNNNTVGSTSMLFGQNSANYGYCWNRANEALLFGTNDLERMRIDTSGYITSLPTYNNGSASSANMVVNSSGLFLRSVSSGKYKTDVEDVQDSYVNSLLNIRPVYYRSLLENDNSEHSHWGFIAEEVAEIDPRLVHYKTVDVSYTDDGERVETELKTPEPEGVQYERFVPLMLKLIQNQQTLIESLTARIAALEE